MPAASAGLPIVSVFFWLRPLTVLMKQIRQAIRAIKQPILLRFLCPAFTIEIVLYTKIISYLVL